jgi:hypothetical protein
MHFVLRALGSEFNPGPSFPLALGSPLSYFYALLQNDLTSWQVRLDGASRAWNTAGVVRAGICFIQL